MDLDKIKSESDTETEAETESEQQDDFKDLLEKVKKSLDGQVEDVRLSKRLTDSPACLVVDEHAMSAHLERLLREAGQAVPGSKPHLELNPDHALVTRLKEEQDEQRFADWSHLLFEQALLAEGGQLEDPASFVRRLNALLTLNQ